MIDTKSCSFMLSFAFRTFSLKNDYKKNELENSSPLSDFFYMCEVVLILNDFLQKCTQKSLTKKTSDLSHKGSTP
jgi:hypothetical protein